MTRSDVPPHGAGPRRAGRAPDGGEPLAPTDVHDAVGGLAAFQRLVAAFYARVECDELLRPQYPDDLEPGKRHLAWFLAQFFGGGPVYSSRRGHPRLRLRHARFHIGPDEAARWVELMEAAVREQRWPPAAEAQVLAYVRQATPTLVNRFPDAGQHLPQQPGGPSPA